MGADRVHRRGNTRRMTIDGHDPIALAKHAVGRLAFHDPMDRGRRHDRLDRRVEGAERPVAVEAARREYRPEDHERDKQVHRRARENHHDALPGCLGVVRAAGHLRLEVPDFLGVHARDLHVSPRRYRPHRILGLPPAHTDERRWEEQREALHAHADGLGDREVPELLEHDQDDDAEDCQDPAHGPSVAGETVESATPRRPLRGDHRTAETGRAAGVGAAAAHLSLATISPASVLACLSDSYRDSKARTGSEPSSESVRSMTSGIWVKRSRLSRNAWTAISLAAVSPHGAVTPARAASPARRRQGKASRSTASKVSSPTEARSSGTTGSSAVSPPRG